MMLLTTGTITFDAGSFDKCHETQTIKGVLYAKEFKSINVEKNTNLDNPKRCTEGNLHIKGIAIGKGLDMVMKGRRSNLNNRFTVG
ncbi:MAG: hypothetical protein LBI53_02190 [Candidatus Peribacteria bacterium]|jgi:hypothetical protein|nr:hypothetical protein [Candidatus Peribacteria bacterium]